MEVIESYQTNLEPTHGHHLARDNDSFLFRDLWLIFRQVKDIHRTEK